jgi:D-serine deaminase-like pyridoxal phosphate-dependent protein
MVDSPDHLDLIEKSVGEVPSPIRVCLDVDAGWWPAGGKVRIGAKRSPVHSEGDAAALARSIVERKAFQLVGLMAYEGQIAGVGDAPSRRPLRGLAIREMQKRSAVELSERRARVVEAVSAVAALEFVNGGGTGSLELTSAEVGDLAAGAAVLDDIVGVLALGAGVDADAIAFLSEALGFTQRTGRDEAAADDIGIRRPKVGDRWASCSQCGVGGARCRQCGIGGITATSARSPLSRHQRVRLRLGHIPWIPSGHPQHSLA